MPPEMNSWKIVVYHWGSYTTTVFSSFPATPRAPGAYLKGINACCALLFNYALTTENVNTSCNTQILNTAFWSQSSMGNNCFQNMSFRTYWIYLSIYITQLPNTSKWEAVLTREPTEHPGHGLWGGGWVPHCTSAAERTWASVLPVPVPLLQRELELQLSLSLCCREILSLSSPCA